ncbi:putative membrane protein YuiD [Drosera capensis]
MNITASKPYSYIPIINLQNPNSFSKTRLGFSNWNKTLLRNPRKSSFCCSCKDPMGPIQFLYPILKKIRRLGSKGKTLYRWGSMKNYDIGVCDGELLQNGGLGMALLSASSTAKCRISPFVATLAENPTFVSGVLAWFIAQSMKVVLNFFVERKWDLKILFASGGMPSSHSALCTALSTSVAICHGVADSLFPVCLGFSLIVMYDAVGVRRHAGMQAEVLNKIIQDLFQGHPMSERKLKELLGHTPSQVSAGAVLGILVAYFCCQGNLVAA